MKVGAMKLYVKTLPECILAMLTNHVEIPLSLLYQGLWSTISLTS